MWEYFVCQHNSLPSQSGKAFSGIVHCTSNVICTSYYDFDYPHSHHTTLDARCTCAYSIQSLLSLQRKLQSRRKTHKYDLSKRCTYKHWTVCSKYEYTNTWTMGVGVMWMCFFFVSLEEPNGTLMKHRYVHNRRTWLFRILLFFFFFEQSSANLIATHKTFQVCAHCTL